MCCRCDMHMHVTHDRALVDQRQRRIEFGHWPMLLPLGDELRLLVRKAATGRGSILRWSSRLLGRGIHLSPMSDTWLRSHEADHNKRGADV